MLYTFDVLRTNWKESVDFREKVLGWLQLTTGISFVGLKKNDFESVNIMLVEFKDIKLKS